MQKAEIYEKKNRLRMDFGIWQRAVARQTNTHTSHIRTRGEERSSLRPAWTARSIEHL